MSDSSRTRPTGANWLAATPCFLFTAVLAVLAVVLNLPPVLRIVMVFVAAVLLGLGGALVGRSLRGAGWRPSSGPGSGRSAWRPGDDVAHSEAGKSDRQRRSADHHPDPDRQ